MVFWIIVPSIVFALVAIGIYAWGNNTSKRTHQEIDANIGLFWEKTIPTCINQLEEVSWCGHLPINENGLVTIVIKELKLALRGQHLSYFDGSTNPQQNILEEMKALLNKIREELPESTVWSQNNIRVCLNAVSNQITTIKVLQNRYNLIRMFDIPSPIDVFK